MTPVIIPAEKSLVDEVFSHLEHSATDYSQNLVLFPGKRPAHFLRQKIASNIRRSFIPPAILSMDSVIDTIFEECISESRKKLEAVDSVAILYQINKTAKDPLGGTGFLKPDLFFPLGIKLLNDLEELLIEEISPAKIREIEFESFEESVSADIKERLESLSVFYEEFYSHIRKNNLSTRAERYSEVSRLVEIPYLERYEKVIAAGFFALTRTEARFMRRLLEKRNSNIILQKGPGLDDTLKALGYSGQLHLPADIKQEREERPFFHFIRSPDSHGQVLALNKTLVSPEIREKLNQQTFIILPAPETLFPVVNHTLPVIGKGNYNISLGFPLKRTPLYGFFSSLMELLSGMDDRRRVYVPHYLKFILHPYTKNIYFNKGTELSRLICHSLEQRLAEERTKLFISIEEIETLELYAPDDTLATGQPIGREVVKSHLNGIHKNTITLFFGIKNTGDFAARSAQVIEYIYEHSTAKLHPFFHPFSENFIRALKTISRALVKDIRFENCQGYFNFVKSYLDTCHTPFEGVPLKGVQVIGFLEARNLHAKRVFILDTNEGVLPETSREESLIPFKVRQYIGLPTYSDKEKISSYYFETIIRGAKEVFLYFVENRKKERSRFVAKLLWEAEKRSGKNIPVNEGLIKSVCYSLSLDKGEIKPVKKTVEMVNFLKKFRFSATSIDAFLFCQLRFYHRYILNLTEKKGVTELPDSSRVGQFIHKVLQVLMEEKRGIILTEAHFSESDMERTVSRLFQKEFSGEITGAVYILKRQIITHMKSFFKNYQIPQIQSSTATKVIDVELALEGSFNGYLIRGKIDRVDLIDERFTIIDYKSSSNPGRFKTSPEKIDPGNRDTWEAGLPSVQLPFYLLLYSLARSRRIELLNGKILLLGKNVIDKNIEVNLFSGADTQAEQFKVYRHVISGLLDEITDPELPFRPAKERETKCVWCNYAGFCGEK